MVHLLDRLLKGIATLVVALGLGFASAAHAQDVVPIERVNSNVVVREEPMGEPAPAVGALHPGERAELLESVPYYYKVRLTNGVEGFVSKRWTRIVSPGESSAPTRPLELHFIDVGQGDSTLIICPNGATILIDAGSTSGRSPDEVREYVIDAIDAVGGDIDYLIVSHPDADHYNLLPEVLDEVQIGRAWYVGQRAEYNEPTIFDWINTTAAVATRLGPTYFDPQGRANPNINCGAAQIWILAAAVDHPASRKNAMSIVVMVRLGDFEAIITGDATHATEEIIMQRYPQPWLDIDVLRVGHHGSLATSTSAGWADALSPLAAVFSAGYENGYGHPRAEVVNRLTPHTDAVTSHAFRDARRGTNGPRYDFQDRSVTEAIYSTAVNQTILITTTGQGFETITGR